MCDGRFGKWDGQKLLGVLDNQVTDGYVFRVNQLCVWDTRARPVQNKCGYSAPPVLELSGHVNEYTRGLGFALNKSKDMVAAGSYCFF